MAVADSSEKRPEWCPPGRSPPVTRPVRPGSQASSGSSSKRSNSSSSSRNSPSPTTPLSLAPSTKVRRKSSKQPSNPQFSRPRPSSPASDDGAVSQTSSPDIHDKFKEPDLEPCQRTPSLSSLFSLPKELFFVRDSGQSYELGLSSGQDILTLGSRLAEETQMRCRVQKQLDELDAQLTKVSEHCDEAQSRANDLEQQLNSALEVQAAQQISNQFKSACILSDDRPMPDNPEEFTPENFIWVKQQWDRVAEENLKMDTSLHIAGAQKHRLETEIVRLSRELEKYRKRNIGHGRSMTDAAQQTKEEPPRMTTVATQTDFVDQNNTENKPIESEHQAAPPQLPKVVMTDAAVQAAEQLDEHTLSEQLSDQNTKVSGLLEVSIQESREERLDWELDVCDIQKASVQGSSSQTEASKGKEIACPTTVAHNGQRSMTLGIWPPQPLASNISQENSIVRLQWENERLRKENQRLRNALEQHQNENSRPEGPESQNSNASSEEAQVRNTDNRAEIQDADVEMRGITVGQVSAAQLNIEALVVPAIPPETSEAGEILQFNLQRFLSSINRDRIASSDDAKRRRDSQRHERRRQREQWRIERDEEARQQQRERSQREEDARRHQQRRLRRERETQRTHKHHKQSLKVCKQKKKVPSLLGWVRYRRTWMGSFSFSYMFPPPLELS